MPSTPTRPRHQQPAPPTQAEQAEQAEQQSVRQAAQARRLVERLSALPEDPSRHDPQARPYRQRVRLRLADACRDLPQRPLRTVWERLAARPWPAPGPAEAGIGLAEVAATVAAPLRHEVVNPYAEHRLYPSPRSKFPVRVAVSDGSGQHLVVPELDALVEIGGTAGAAGPAGLETASALAALPGFYGDLRPVLAGLETGHLLAALADTGRALGLPLTVTGPAAGDWPDWLAERTGPVLPGFRLAPTEVARPAANEPGRDDDPSWAEVGWLRNSGRAPGGFYGFTARHGGIPADGLTAMLTAAARGAADAGYLGQWLPAVRAFCAVRAVAGLPDGLYEAPLGSSAEAAGPAGLRRIGDLDALRGGLVIDSTPAAGLAYDLAGCNLVWMLAVDAERAVRPQGPEAAFPGVLAAVGWLAQQLCMGAASTRLFARPLRSFDAATVAAAIGAHDTLVPIYQVACGRNRFSEPAIDLRFPPAGATGGDR
ncbi:hypothetical protein ACFRMQ_28755 [Kitasatospora sp. NPDC056783]|uniref:hypothetical protein n=1 Tax=Kitasatospora sp. NPDC056783 TaxID=3345943 RepID=UPI0036BB139A